MFERTVVTLGELVRDDVELGTLYIFLNLLTPSSAASSTTKVTKIYQGYVEVTSLWKT
jgi:hypothetical protein